VSIIPLIVSASFAISPLASTSSLPFEVPLGHRLPLCDARPDCQVASHEIDVARQIFQGARHAFDFSLAAKGEIAKLADTINGMIDTLATFADQVTTVAREVGVEGKLGGQASVPGAAGTWKDLTDNVNQLAANSRPRCAPSPRSRPP